MRLSISWLQDSSPACLHRLLQLSTIDYARGGRGLGQQKGSSDVNRTHFLYRIDMWTIDGKHVIEHLAGVEDAQLAMATYQTACKRWPGTVITLRQGAKVIEDNRQERTA
jgi:hypothetical protein